MLTKDRIGAVLAVVAAVVGLVLVFTTRDADQGAGDDDGPPVATAPAVPGRQAPDADDAKPGAPDDNAPRPAPAAPGADNDNDND